jgi:hypothetical protein
MFLYFRRKNGCKKGFIINFFYKTCYSIHLTSFLRIIIEKPCSK